MTRPMVSAQDLRLRLGERLVLDGISFEVGPGESVALTGPNGSGKTSVLRCLLGLVPFSGRASIDGHDVREEPVAARALVGYLPQKAAFGDVRADEALRFVARLRGIDPGRIGPVLAEVGLAAHARERVRGFSGGMQQRLSLAVALLGDAPVLLLDEPTASLDRSGQRAFLDTVRYLRQRGRTLVLASHRSDEIAALTDRIIELDAGRILDPGADGGRLADVIPLARAGERR